MAHSYVEGNYSKDQVKVAAFLLSAGSYGEYVIRQIVTSPTMIEACLMELRDTGCPAGMSGLFSEHLNSDEAVELAVNDNYFAVRGITSQTRGVSEYMSELVDVLKLHPDEARPIAEYADTTDGTGWFDRAKTWASNFFSKLWAGQIEISLPDLDKIEEGIRFGSSLIKIFKRIKRSGMSYEAVVSAFRPLAVSYSETGDITLSMGDLVARDPLFMTAANRFPMQELGGLGSLFKSITKMAAPILGGINPLAGMGLNLAGNLMGGKDKSQTPFNPPEARYASPGQFNNSGFSASYNPDSSGFLGGEGAVRRPGEINLTCTMK